MGHLEGNFTPVLYMGRKVPKGYIHCYELKDLWFCQWCCGRLKVLCAVLFCVWFSVFCKIVLPILRVLQEEQL